MMDSSRSNGSISKNNGGIARFFKPISKQGMCGGDVAIDDPVKTSTSCKVTNSHNRPRRPALKTNKRKVRRNQSNDDSDTEADDDDSNDEDWHDLESSVSKKKKRKSECMQEGGSRHQTRSSNAKKSVDEMDFVVAKPKSIKGDCIKELEVTATCQPYFEINVNGDIEVSSQQITDVTISSQATDVKRLETSLLLEDKNSNDQSFKKNEHLKDSDDFNILVPKDDSMDFKDSGTVQRNGRSCPASVIGITSENDDALSDEEVHVVRRHRSANSRSVIFISSEDEESAKDEIQSNQVRRRIKMSEKRIDRSEQRHSTKMMIKDSVAVQEKLDVGSGIAKYFKVTSNSVDKSSSQKVGKSATVREKLTDANSKLLSDCGALKANGKSSKSDDKDVLRKKLSRTEIAIQNLEAKKLKNEKSKDASNKLVSDCGAPSVNGKSSKSDGKGVLRKKLSRTEIAIQNLEAKKLKNEKLTDVSNKLLSDCGAPSVNGKSSKSDGKGVLRKKLSRTEIAIQNLEAKKLKTENKSTDSDIPVARSEKRNRQANHKSKKENVKHVQSPEARLVPDETRGLRRSPRVRAMADSFVRYAEESCNDVSSKERTRQPSYSMSMLRNNRGKHKLRMKISLLKRSKDEPTEVVRAKRLLIKARSVNAKLEQARCKLAPIFSGRAKSKKRMKKMNAAMLRRRRQFLMSGIPEKLRQEADNAKARAELIGDGWFSTIGHVTQTSSNLVDHSCHSINDLKLTLKVTKEYCGRADLKWHLRELTDIKLSDFEQPFISERCENLCTRLSEEQVQTSLDLLKASNSSLPVETLYKFYLERKSKVAAMNIGISMAGDDDEVQCVGICGSDGSEVVTPKPKSLVPDEFGHTLWTTDYQPEFYQNVVGNEDTVQQLRTWLRDWKKENLKDVMRNGRQSSRKRKPSDNDFESDGSCITSSDDDVCCNTVLLVGPPGSGKTCAVYAIAKEHDFKVLEVNASSRRSGKLLLERLREATQSHQVAEAQKTDEHEPKKIHSFFTSVKTKKDAPKDKKARKTVAPTSKDSPSGLSLLLLEDVDVVFSEDDGFWSAVNTFMETAKRPVVLTTNDPMFANRGRIRCGFEEVQFRPPEIRTQALHLQLMCLADSHCVSSELMASLLRQHEADLRRSILSLQFWCKSNVCPMRDGDCSLQDHSMRTKLDAAHGCLPHTLGALRFKVPFQIEADLKSKFIGKIVIEKRPSSDSGEVVSALTHVLDSWCVMDRLMDGQPEPKQDARVRPGLEDTFSTLESGDSLFSEISDCLSDLVLKHTASVLEPLKPWKDSLIQSCLESDSSIKGFQQESLKAIDTVAACILPFRQCNFSAFVMDYMPSLRHICWSEQTKCSGDGRRARRCKSYLLSLWNLNSDVISKLVPVFDTL